MAQYEKMCQRENQIMSKISGSSRYSDGYGSLNHSQSLKVNSDHRPLALVNPCQSDPHGATKSTFYTNKPPVNQKIISTGHNNCSSSSSSPVLTPRDKHHDPKPCDTAPTSQIDTSAAGDDDNDASGDRISPKDDENTSLNGVPETDSRQSISIASDVTEASFGLSDSQIVTRL